MKLTIIYGSESLLLRPYISSISGKVVRIFNKIKPKSKKNFFDYKNINNNFDTLDAVIKKYKNISQITFVGAAAITDNGLFRSLSKKEIKKQTEVNIVNYIKITSLLIPYMSKINNGCFIYLSSFRSQKPTKGTVLYSASKAFGETFFKGIGIEYGRFNITSHIIRMGAFEGKMLFNLNESYKNRLKKNIGLNKFGTANELTSLIKFCEKNKYTNSGVLEINGGLDIE